MIAPARLVGLVSAAVLLAAGLGATAAAGAADAPRVWIDQPLAGSKAPLGPLPVTVHAADAAGIASVTLLVDGMSAAVLAAPPGDLVTVTWTWRPTAAGTHLLTALAASPGGRSSDPVSAAVTFGEVNIAPPSASPTAATSPPPTPKPHPSPTATATPAPCRPPAPMLLVPSNGYLIYDAVDTNPPSFEWAYRPAPSCRATSFRIRVSTSGDLSSPLYSKIVAAGGALAWTWAPPAALPVARACTVYYWAVTARASDGSSGGRTPIWDFAICPTP